MRPSPSQFTNPSGLIDKRIGKNFEAIEYVRENLGTITHLSYYMESLFNLDRNLTLLSDENVDHHILKDITIFQGPSAYELALKNGFVGTLAEWLDSLIGDKGQPGPEGIIDTITLNGILENIQTNADNVAAAISDISVNTDAFGDLVTTEVFNASNAALTVDLDARDANISSELADILALIPSNSSIISLAQDAVQSTFNVVDAAIDTTNARIDGANGLLDLLREDLDDGTTAFNTFLLQNDETIIRLQAAEARSGENTASIITLDQVTSEFASAQQILQAESATSFANISDLQTVTGDSATQINVLQVANNENYGSIVSLQTIQDGVVTDLNALTLDVGENHSYSTETRTLADGNASAVSALGVRTGEAESSIITLQEVTGDTVTDLSALTTRTEEAESSIVDLDTLTATTASSLSALDTRVGDAEGSITTLESTKADQSGLNAEAARIDNLTSRTENTESSITTLETTKADQAALTAEAGRIDVLGSRVSQLTPPGITAGATGTVKIHNNTNNGGYNAGELLLSAGYLEHEDLGIKREFPGNVLVTTGFEGTGNTTHGEPFYLMWTQSKNDTRFFLDVHDDFVIVSYDPVNLEWVHYKTNTISHFPFTPEEEDRLIAVGRKVDGDIEITYLNTLINFTNVEAEVTTIIETKADAADLTAEAIRIDALVSRTDATEGSITTLQTTKADQIDLIAEAGRIDNVQSSVAVLNWVLPTVTPTSETWTTHRHGLPQDKADMPPQFIINDYYERLGASATHLAGPKATFPLYQEAIYEVTVDYEHISGTLADLRIFATSTLSDGTHGPGTGTVFSSQNTVAGRQVLKYTFNVDGSDGYVGWDNPDTAQRISFVTSALEPGGSTDTYYRIHSMKIDEVGRVETLAGDALALDAAITTLENTKADGQDLTVIAEKLQSVQAIGSAGGEIQIDEYGGMFTDLLAGDFPHNLRDITDANNISVVEHNGQNVLQHTGFEYIRPKAWYPIEEGDVFTSSVTRHIKQIVNGVGKSNSRFRLYKDDFTTNTVVSSSEYQLGEGQTETITNSYTVTENNILSGYKYISFEIVADHSPAVNDIIYHYDFSFKNETVKSQVSTLETSKADLSALTAEAGRITLVESRVDTVEDDIEEAVAEIGTLENTKADAAALTAEATRIDNLTTRVGSAEADISTIENTKADLSELTATASRLDRIYAGLAASSVDMFFDVESTYWAYSHREKTPDQVPADYPADTTILDNVITVDGLERTIYSRPVLSVDRGKSEIFEFSCEFRVDRLASDGDADSRLLFLAYALNSEYRDPGATAGAAVALSSGRYADADATGWTTVTWLLSTYESNPPPGVGSFSVDPDYAKDNIYYIRPAFQLNYNNGDGKMSARNFQVRNVTDTFVNEAAITEEAQTRTTETEALSSLVTNLTSRTGDAEADIVTLQSTKADDSDLTAEANRINALTTRVNTAESDIIAAETDISTIETSKADAADLTAQATRVDNLYAALPVSRANLDFDEDQTFMFLSGREASPTATNSGLPAYASVHDGDHGPEFVIAGQESRLYSRHAEIYNKTAPRIYEMHLEFKVDVEPTNGSSNNRTRLFAYGLDKDYDDASVSGATVSIVKSFTPTNSDWQSCVFQFSTGPVLVEGIPTYLGLDGDLDLDRLKYIRFGIEANYNNGNGTTRLRNLHIYDITDAHNNAAAVSAQVITEAAARVQEDNALATLISTLTSSVGDNTADIATTALALSTAEGSIATLQTDVSTAGSDASLALSTAQDNQGDLQSTVTFAVTAGSGGKVELLANSDGSSLTLDVDEVIASGSVSADKLDVNTLSAVSANVGVLRTATTGQRLEIRHDKIVVYDSNNVIRVKIGNLN